MRLMAKDLHRYRVYQTVAVKSEYVGTKWEKKLQGSFVGCRENVTDELSAEIYGESIRNMIKVTCSASETEISVSGGDFIESEDDGWYKVMSVLRYSDHFVVTAKKDYD